MVFKANADRRHYIPRQRLRVTNRAEYDAGLRARGSLTVWFSEAAVEGWRAEARAGRGGRRKYSALVIATALTLRAVFRLALRQTEGLIDTKPTKFRSASRKGRGAGRHSGDRGRTTVSPSCAWYDSILQLLGLDLPVPDHSTLCRQAETLEVGWPRCGREAMHLLVDSTGLQLCGPGGWLEEKHGTKQRRAWKVLHLATDAGTGQIVASLLTGRDADDGSQVGPLLERVDGSVASFSGDGASDWNDVYAAVAARHPDAAVVPPRASAVLSAIAETTPSQRDEHLRCIAERGRMGWQCASGYKWGALVESDISRWKRVIGGGLGSQPDGRQTTEVAIAADVLNRVLALGRPEYVRDA
ncbi:IS5 family transposase [Belnapia moabensis]|uniref:IS5 family transposase n=1 Tax=Belnapia moabensis TaxID=365533 RepID=UPI0005B9B4DE|nr:IS5 family transposase [Belnapia moabensis]